MQTTIISLGGSVIVPKKIDLDFLKCQKSKISEHAQEPLNIIHDRNIPPDYDLRFLTKFKNLIKRHSKTNKFIIICGGGKLARTLQNKAKQTKSTTNKDLDWLGIYATRINALILKKIFNIKQEIITNPTEKITSKENILIAAGWKPGFSTDYDAVLLAKNLKANKIINITNVDYVYNKDPKLNGAKPIKQTTWKQLRKIVGDKWKPGLNMPFDPIASKQAEKLKLKVIITGKNINNLNKILKNKSFKGTIITK